jgi:serine protease Do
MKGWGVVRVFAVVLAAVLSLSQAFARGAPDSFSGLAERLSPAVVNIATQSADKARDGALDLTAPPGSPLENILRSFRGGNKETPQRVQSLGSGFIIDAAGIIVTNNHVIADAVEITVGLSDGSRLAAEVIGRDPKTDIALLRIKPRRPLIAVGFGDSDTAKVGDWVLAIGNPFGLGGSVTAGIISARNRELAAELYDDFIQTDAAINRGNSGGPLFDMDGRVIGLNAAIISPTGGSIGIGFAIPSNTVAKVVAQLREYGSTRRGWIGVNVQGLTDDIAEGLLASASRGALVQGVSGGGPAAQGGLRRGDIVVKFDGKDVADDRVMQRFVIETQVGRVVPVSVLRRGKPVVLNVKVASREAHDHAQVAQAARPPAAMPRPQPSSLGLKLSALTPEMRVRYRVPMALDGLLVVAVDRGTSASDNDIRPGDIIIEVGQEPVKTAQDLNAKIAGAKKAQRKVVLLTLSRAGELSFRALKLPQRQG